MSRQARDEPSLGSVDMSEVEFRRPRRSRPRGEEAQHRGLWWQIALGVFTALLAHSIVTGLYVRWEIYTGLKALGAAFESDRKGPQPTPSASAGSEPIPRPRARPVPMRALSDDERCVSGKRFRRVENGWVQVLEACR